MAHQGLFALKIIFGLLVHVESGRRYAVIVTRNSNLVLCDVMFIRTL
jgi:hypothetical protein